MALAGSGDTLGDLIASTFGIPSDPGLSSSEKTTITNKWKDMTADFISHYVTNTVVSTTVSTTTSCPAGAGTGAGPGTGVIG